MEVEGEGGEVGDAGGGGEGWDGGEFMEDWGVGDGFGVFHSGAGEEGAVVVVEIEEKGGVWVGGSVVGEIVECGDERGVGCDGVGSRSSPHGALGEGFKIEAGDDAEVVTAAAEGEVEVRMRGPIYVDDLGVCEDDLGRRLEDELYSGESRCSLYLIISDIVTCEPVAAGEE